jgi:large-conductance mechanosensitive channel
MSKTTDLINTVSSAQKTIRLVTDTASDFVIYAGEQKLRKIFENSRKNLIISIVLNGDMFIWAALTAFFRHSIKDAGVFIAALINYVILGRVIFNILRFIRTLWQPYHTLITYLLPVFWAGLKKLKSLQGAIKDTIRAALRYLYKDKMPETVRKIISFSSAFNLIKNWIEIEDKAAADFYPLVCRFLRVALLYNILLFTVCYGLLIFVVKYSASF